MSVLIIDDNKDLVQILAEGLARSGQTVGRAYSAEEGLEALAVSEFGCIVLDILLPGMDGLQMLDRIRSDGSDIPVLILSARATVEDILSGFEHGADDYLTKPFDLRELIARVQALQRRSSKPRPSPIVCGALRLDPVTRECRWNDRLLPLRRKEFDILELLLSHEGEVFTRERIVETLWKGKTIQRSNIVDVHIKHLRDSLHAVQCDTLITTIRGVGYKASCPTG